MQIITISSEQSCLLISKSEILKIKIQAMKSM